MMMMILSKKRRTGDLGEPTIITIMTTDLMIMMVMVLMTMMMVVIMTVMMQERGTGDLESQYLLSGRSLESQDM